MQISGASQGTIAEVSTMNRLYVDSVTQERPAYYSSVKGTTFSWFSTYSAGAGNYVMSIKNTDPNRALHIDKIICSNTVASIWKVGKLTAGTPAGTTITSVNMNFNSGFSAQATSFGNASVTGITGVDDFLGFQTGANATFPASCDGNTIITTNQTIVINVSAAGTVAVTLVGWFE